MIDIIPLPWLTVIAWMLVGSLVGRWVFDRNETPNSEVWLGSLSFAAAEFVLLCPWGIA
jgi:hypothetical protein